MYWDYGSSSDESQESYQKQYMHTFCGKCNREFVNGLALSQHLQNRQAHFYCRPCGRYFVNGRALDQHISNSSAHPQCSVCYRRFEFEQWMEEHKAEDHPQCHLCGTLFRDAQDLDMHQQRDHKWCRHCQKLFVDQQALRQHQATSDNHPVCQYCETRFAEESDLEEHEEDNHPRCLICHRMLIDSQALIGHKEIEHPAYTKVGGRWFLDSDGVPDTFFDENSGRVKCIRPNRVTTRKYPAQCELCWFKFRDYSLLLSHKQRKHPESIRAWLCDSDGNRRYHDERHRRCQECFKTFANTDDLEQHKKHVRKYGHPGAHSQQRSSLSDLCCYKCNRRFKNEFGLMQHFAQSVTHIQEREKGEWLQIAPGMLSEYY